MSKRIRKLAATFRRTPLHPQWFAFLRERKNLADTCRNLRGIVLDVGCAEGLPRKLLSRDAHYIGLDYYSTATEWYGTRPDIFGDAQLLPLADNCVNHALLLDVLEHIPDPKRCLRELHRVLAPGGSLTLQVPFLYPLHDAPLDFHRWTRFGLHRLAETIGFSTSHEIVIGHPLETAALNANIAMSQSVVSWIKHRNPLALLFPLLPFIVLITNTTAWLLAALSHKDDFMPYAYRAVWNKR